MSLTKWQKKLTKVERRHMRECNAVTLEDVRKNVEFQAENRFPCWTCVSIGRKLDITVNLKAFNAQS